VHDRTRQRWGKHRVHLRVIKLGDLKQLAQQVIASPTRLGSIFSENYSASAQLHPGGAGAQLHSQSDWNVTNAFSNFPFNSCG
jgi:hypothetical protein